MNRFITVFAMSAMSFALFASTITFNENETVSLTLSQTNYNRVMITGDKIKKASCPEQYLAIEYEKDGSVIFDVLYTKPFTVFFETKDGHHFSANVESKDGLGKTIQLKPLETIVRTEPKALEANIEQPQSNDLVLNLIQALSKDSVPDGYVGQSTFSGYKNLNKSLRFKVSKRMTGEAFEGERIEVYNHSSLPVVLNESWFSDHETRGVSLSKPIINPHEAVQVFRVLEKVHA